MATLTAKDKSEIYRPKNGEAELEGGRTRSFKVFKNGRQRRVAGQIGPIHYRQDPFSDSEQFKEIDLELVPTPDKHWDYAMNDNGYQIRIWNRRRIQGEDFLCVGRFKRANKYIEIAPVRLFWENAAGDTQLISETLDTGEPEIDNDANTITWRDAFGPGLHYRYNLAPDKFVKAVIVDDFWRLPTPTIGATGLKLTVELRMFWHGRAKAANGFGEDDEERRNPKKFQYQDELDRDIWWVQEPMAWDSAKDRQILPLDWRLRKRGNRITALISIPESELGGLVYPLFIDTAISEEQVGAGADDAFKAYQGDLAPTFSNSSILRIDYGSANFHAFVNGMRFTGVPIPQGSTIGSASLTVYSRASVTGDVDSEFQGLDSDDATTNFSSEANWDSMYPSGVTTASVDYNNQPNWTIDTWYTLKDISPIIGEIVLRAGWNEGALIIYWGDYDDDTPLGRARFWDSYDSEANKATKFNATYTTPFTGGQIIGPMFV